ncbi:MAG: Hsp70 family protein [Candidatus Lokiarchaeota archaeon]|nr:Hsp70 family protein [Candidatus Lokiarchaeota archaeon]
MTLTRAKMEHLIDPILKRLDAPILKALKEANLIKEGSDLQNLKIKSYSLLLLSLTRLYQKLDSKWIACVQKYQV